MTSLRLDAATERDMAFLAQNAQRVLLVLLNEPKASAAEYRKECECAERFLLRLGELLAPPPEVSETDVPDAKAREGLQLLIARGQAGTGLFGIPDDDREAITATIRTLLDGSRPNEPELLRALRFFQRAVEQRVTSRDSPRLSREELDAVC